MVKITQQYLIRHSDRLLPNRLKNESDSEFLQRVTHLKLQSRFIDQMETLTNCKNVTYLYLQNNLIESIQNLDSMSGLTHLYLQRNKISKLQNFDNLVNLKKLYLGYNEITVVENLDNCRVLKELHLENQILPLGESLHFDPRCVNSLSGCLEVLNVANDGLLNMAPITNLRRLTDLCATENKLADLQDLTGTLQHWPVIKSLKLHGNPVVRQRNVKDFVIINSKSLKYFDNFEITPTTRTFVEGWYRTRRRAQPASLMKNESECSQSVDGKYDFEENKPFAKGRRHLPVTDTSNIYKYQPWKLRKNLHLAIEPALKEPSPVREKRPVIHHVTFN